MNVDYGNYKVRMGDGFTSFKRWTVKAKGTIVLNLPAPNRYFFYVDDPLVAMLGAGKPILIKCQPLPTHLHSMLAELKQMEEMYKTYSSPELAMKIQHTRKNMHDYQESGTGAVRYIKSLTGKRVILNKALDVAPTIGGSVTWILGYSRDYVDEKATEEVEQMQREIRGKAWV